MPNDLNKVQFIGRLGSNPEIKFTQSGVARVNISLATNREWTKDGEKVKKTDWHNLVFWDKGAEILERYCKKGKLLYIEGRLETRKWEDGEGRTRYTTEVVVNNFQMVGGKDDHSNEAEARTTEREELRQERETARQKNEADNRADGDGWGSWDDEDDDLPF